MIFTKHLKNISCYNYISHLAINSSLKTYINKNIQPKMETLFAVSKKKDQELTMSKIMNSLLHNSDLN